MTSRRAIDSFTEIATLRIELEGSEPPIWRVVDVPTSITLKVLHDIVQAAMGWLDYHLWEMVVDDQTYGLPMDEDWGTTPRKVAVRTRLRDLLASGTTNIRYTYDFGDNWAHSLVIIRHIAGHRSRSETENPIAHRLWPAGSGLQDFRTPAGIRNSSGFATVRFFRGARSEADIAPRPCRTRIRMMFMLTRQHSRQRCAVPVRARSPRGR